MDKTDNKKKLLHYVIFGKIISYFILDFLFQASKGYVKG